MINRNDMLELTRRMTDSRTNLVRVAGAYLDEDGYVDGTFNTNFRTLKGAEKQRTLEIAKAVPFSKTNEELIQYKVPGMKPGSIWQLMYALWDCELKNDALLLTLYELIGEKIHIDMPYAVYVYYGAYDIPAKASDGARLDESVEVYRYMIITLSRTDEEQKPSLPFAGLIWPVLTNRSLDISHVNVYSEKNSRAEAADLIKLLGLSDHS